MACGAPFAGQNTQHSAVQFSIYLAVWIRPTVQVKKYIRIIGLIKQELMDNEWMNEWMNEFIYDLLSKILLWMRKKITGNRWQCMSRNGSKLRWGFCRWSIFALNLFSYPFLNCSSLSQIKKVDEELNCFLFWCTEFQSVDIMWRWKDRINLLITNYIKYFFK